MAEKKSEILFSAVIFLVCFVFGVTVLFGGLWRNEQLLYDKLAAVAVSLPGEKGEIVKAIRDTESFNLEEGRRILKQYGYVGRLPDKELWLCAGSLITGAGGAVLFMLFIRVQRRKLRERALNLTGYLRRVEEGDYSMTLTGKQDMLSGLEDEIYKTVLALRESRESLRQEKENLAKDLADISHQFKTPLTSISILSELLLRRIPEEETLLAVRKIGKQTDRLTELCAALLTLSRADAGVLSFDIRETMVSDLIECSLECVRPLLDKKEQRVRILCEENIWQSASVFCDAGWTREAMGNLLKNAAEHGPERSEIVIRIRDNPIYTGIAVEDEGPGFSAIDLSRLFERFYRGTNAGKDSAGIGLSLAKSLIESQKGEIRAENRREGGGRFLIKFYKNL